MGVVHVFGTLPIRVVLQEKVIYLELKTFLVLYCFFVFSFVFFCVGIIVKSLHFRRIVVVCEGRPWRITRHGVVYPCGVIHSWIFCVLIRSYNLRFLIFLFWCVHLWNFFFLFWCCHSWDVLLVWCCQSWDFHLVVILFHSCEISGVVLIVVVGVVAIWDRITQAVKKSRLGFWSSAPASACTRSITCVGTGRGVMSGTEVEEQIVTLEVSCWSETDSGFFAGLRGVA